MSDVTVPAICVRCNEVHDTRISVDEALRLGLDPNRALQPLHMTVCAPTLPLGEKEEGK